MGDFGQVGTASLWKSGPLFSTGTKEAELMLEELRLNPWSSRARTWRRSSGDYPAAGNRGVDAGLSTGFAERARPRSTGPWKPIHAVWGGKEEVL
jgi:hypothetical protein